MVAGTSGGGFGGNQANINVQLKPVGVRKMHFGPGDCAFAAQDVRHAWRDHVPAERPGRAHRRTAGQRPIPIHAAGAGLRHALPNGAPRVLDTALGSFPRSPTSAPTSRIPGLSSNVIIDRDTASRLGLTAQAVDSALYDAFGQRQVSVMYKSINQYHVVLALAAAMVGESGFSQYHLRPDASRHSTFLYPRYALHQGITPISLPHQGQFPATTYSFNLTEGIALSDAVTAINRAEVEMGLPANITGKFAGTAQAVSGIAPESADLIGTALLAVYIVLGMLYESLIHPLTIISTLPSAGVGALMAMVLFKSKLDIVAHDRNYSADRHRQEECDHDDRFRSGGRAQRRTEYARSHLSGLVCCASGPS